MLKIWCLTFLIRIKTKKIHRILLQSNQSLWIKSYIEFTTQKRIDAEKNGDKDGKPLYKLMNSAVYGKSMEISRK